MQLYLFNLFNDKMLSFCTLSSLSQAADKSLLMNLIENAYLIIIIMLLTSQNIISEMQLICKKLITQKSIKSEITISKYLSALYYTSHSSSTVTSLYTLHLNSVFISISKSVITSQHCTLSNFFTFLFIYTDIISMSHHNHYINNKLNFLYCFCCLKHISNNISQYNIVENQNCNYCKVL